MRLVGGRALNGLFKISGAQVVCNIGISFFLLNWLAVRDVVGSNPKKTQKSREDVSPLLTAFLWKMLREAKEKPWVSAIYYPRLAVLCLSFSSSRYFARPENGHSMASGDRACPSSANMGAA